MSPKSDKNVVDPLQDPAAFAHAGRTMLIARTFVRCAKCSRDFRSTLTFKTLPEFERAATLGFIAQCPNCFTIFDCNRSNMYCELAPDSDAPSVVPIPTRRQSSE